MKCLINLIRRVFIGLIYSFYVFMYVDFVKILFLFYFFEI